MAVGMVALLVAAKAVWKAVSMVGDLELYSVYELELHLAAMKVGSKDYLLVLMLEKATAVGLDQLTVGL